MSGLFFYLVIRTSITKEHQMLWIKKADSKGSAFKLIRFLLTYKFQFINNIRGTVAFVYQPQCVSDIQ